VSADVTREYPVGILTAAGKPLPIETLTPAHVGGVFHSITVDNESNCAVGVYLNRLAYGAPSTTLQSNTYKTTLADARSVTIAVQAPAGDQPRGTVYVHCTEQYLAAAAGFSSGSAPTAVWDQSRFDSPDVMGS